MAGNREKLMLMHHEKCLNQIMKRQEVIAEGILTIENIMRDFILRGVLPAPEKKINKKKTYQ